MQRYEGIYKDIEGYTRIQRDIQEYTGDKSDGVGWFFKGFEFQNNHSFLIQHLRYAFEKDLLKQL